MRETNNLINIDGLEFYGEKIFEKKYNYKKSKEVWTNRTFTIYKTINGRYIAHDVCSWQNQTFKYETFMYSSRSYEDDRPPEPREEYTGTETQHGGHNITEVFDNAKEIYEWINPEIRVEVAENLVKVDENFKEYKTWLP